jgi:UDP-N-acetylmuramyl pentapeptide phosphotransferase/UDP-N-acetylglucosamine-1-phosphate transferase
MVAALVTVVLTPVVRRALIKSALLDIPNLRSSHTLPVPRGGGLAVAVGALVSVAFGGWSTHVAAIATASIFLGAIGLADDRWGLPPLGRLVAQIIVPMAAVPFLLGVAGLGATAAIAGVVLSTGWCAAYINAFNFMDGINGIAVGQTVVAGGALAWMTVGGSDATAAILGGAVAGAAIGFAPFNLANASIFLGDVGSYFLGTWLALVLVLVVADGVPILVALGPFVLYLCDTGTTLVLRFRRGVRLLDAHREHAYQRLVALGLSHGRVAALATAVIVVNSTVLLASQGGAWWWQAAAMCVAIAASGGFIALPIALAARQSSAVV